MSKILLNSKEDPPPKKKTKKNRVICNGYIKIQNHPECLFFEMAYGCLQSLHHTKVQIVLLHRKQPELRLDTS